MQGVEGSGGFVWPRHLGFSESSRFSRNLLRILGLNGIAFHFPPGPAE